MSFHLCDLTLGGDIDSVLMLRCPLSTDFMGVGEHWLLVQQLAGPQRTIPHLVIRRQTEPVLDDRVFQPPGITKTQPLRH